MISKIKKGPLYLLALYLLTFRSFASTYCFSDQVSLQKVEQVVSEFLIKNDSLALKPAANCIELAVGDSRKGLIDKIIRMNFKVKGTYGTSTTFETRTCHYEILKLDKLQNRNQAISIVKKLHVSGAQFEENIVSQQKIKGLVGKWVELEVDGLGVKLLCDPRGGDLYELSVAIKSGKEKLVTNVLVKKGRPTELGSVVKELNNKNNTGSVQNGLSLGKQKAKKKYHYVVVLR